MELHHYFIMVLLMSTISITLVLADSKTYIVTPSPSTPCAFKKFFPCFTLSEYASKPSGYFASTTALTLLPGFHYSLDLELSIEKLTKLSIQGSTPTNNSNTVITCKNESVKFSFQNIDVVEMSGLVFVGCVKNEVKTVEQFTMENCSFQGEGRGGNGLQLTKVTTLNIMRSSFSSFVNRDKSFMNYVFGGAICLRDIKLGILSNCIFNNNSCVTDARNTKGGAIYCQSCSNVTLENCSLTNHNVHQGNGGAIYAEYGAITIRNSILSDNYLARQGGAIFGWQSSISIIDNCTLNNNTVGGDDADGGAVYVYDGSLTIDGSTLSNNLAQGAHGGAVHADSSPVTIKNSVFNNNMIKGGDPYHLYLVSYGTGGAINGQSSKSSPPIVIINCTLHNNTIIAAYAFGGALYADSGIPCTIISSTFSGNGIILGNITAGGALYVPYTLTVQNSTLKDNFVVGKDGVGGAIYSSYSHATIVDAVFSNNSVEGQGATIYLLSVALNVSGFLNLHHNKANTGVLYAVDSTLLLSGSVNISNNYGSFSAYSSNVTFTGTTNIMNNTYLSNASQEGGAITATQCEMFFNGEVNLVYNRAVQGGAISATQSKLYMYGNVVVSDNTALMSGGGIYAYQSELNFQARINVYRNSAIEKGGGIHAIGLTMRFTKESKSFIFLNHARLGGGMYLERNAKIYILKTETECIHFDVNNYRCKSNSSTWITLHLYNNTAQYGGAVYVADDTNSVICNATPFSDRTTFFDECFIQSISLYRFSDAKDKVSLDNFHISNTNFTNNSATIAGDILYGGLLDRCAASPFSEIFQKYPSSTSSSLSAMLYMVNITDIALQDFRSSQETSSDPVRVCFCKRNLPDCSYIPQPKSVRKGQAFTISLAAVDQINNTVSNSSIIHASVSIDAKLGEGLSRQQTYKDGSCTELTYVILSPHKSERLKLYADGPCMGASPSTTHLTVNIVHCPIGFYDAKFRCQCDPALQPEYVSNCSIDSEAVQRKDNVWFAYVNTTDHEGYILHKHCPFDYCHPPTENISVNLNVEDGADELCMFNRSGKLCGSCEDGLSLSLGSSRCMQCTNTWLVLLLVFVLAGIALVALILKLEFTVAEGTFNGLNFYANIFVANRAIFFLHDKSRVLTIFIAWLNLDFGFETCFYDGMDGYVKTWLQFAFPLYVLSLVGAIMIICDYSDKFAKLFVREKEERYVRKKGLAALATLILLSYTKLLRTVIAALSPTTLQYSDGSHELVWLVDANIPYLSGKHIPLFITALVIAVLGILFTIVVFGWQWFVYCPLKGPIQWWIFGNTKVIAFIQAYHHSYNDEHRYWMGLLFLVRVALYLVFTLNIHADPRINLLAINSAIVILFALQLAVEGKNKVHKSRFNEILDLVSFLNLALLTTTNYFITEDKDNRNTVAYVSTSIAFCTFLVILVYHMYQNGLNTAYQRMRDKLQSILEKRKTLETDEHTNNEDNPVSGFTVHVPQPEDCLDDTSYMDGEQFEVSLETSGPFTGSSCQSGRSRSSIAENGRTPLIRTENELTQVVTESHNRTLHIKSVGNGIRARSLSSGKPMSRSLSTPRNVTHHIPKPHSSVDASLKEKSMPNLVPGQEHVSINQTQPQVTLVREDSDTLEVDESTALLHAPS